MAFACQFKWVVHPKLKFETHLPFITISTEARVHVTIFEFHRGKKFHPMEACVAKDSISAVAYQSGATFMLTFATMASTSSGNTASVWATVDNFAKNMALVLPF